MPHDGLKCPRLSFVDDTSTLSRTVGLFTSPYPVQVDSGPLAWAEIVEEGRRSGRR